MRCAARCPKTPNRRPKEAFGVVLLPFLVLLQVGCADGVFNRPSRPPTSWQRVFPSFAAQVNDLLRDPLDPRVVYAACGWQSRGQAPPIGGVLRSADRGKRWVEANQGIPSNTEVIALMFAPPTFVDGRHPSLLAGTRGGGLFFSNDGASSWQPLRGVESTATPDWKRLTIQTMISLPSEPPTVAIGTKGHGVLMSENGGESWQPRNEGLLNLTIQNLSLDPEGHLLASTWYGGIYHSDDRGRHWTSLSTDYERVAVSTLAVGHQGILWVGLQNGGLFAAGTESPERPPIFEPQGVKTIEGSGILAIETQANRVVAGTSGRGAVFGSHGDRFERVEQGLENTSVSAILLAPDDPREVILGTWGGLYRGIPPTPLSLTAALGVVASGLALLFALIAWRRSALANANTLFRRMRGLESGHLLSFLAQEMSQLPKEQAQAILERLTVRLARSKSLLLSGMAQLVAETAPLIGLLNRTTDRADPGARRAIADALDARLETLRTLSSRWESKEETRSAAAITRYVAFQDALFASLLRAESLGHVAALRADLLEVEERARDSLAAPFLNPDLVADLRRILDVVDQLSRLPNAEDRALYLGQALSQTLTALDRLAQRQATAPTFRLRLGAVVLESVRELLAMALHDIHQRAELEVTLHSKVLATQREAVVVLEVKNVGQGHARNIAVDLRPGCEFQSLRHRREVKSLLRNQAALLEFLVEPQVSDRVRLSFRISYDDLERHGQEREFADVVEFRQTVTHRAFTPLRPNPYVVGRPLLDSDIFIGREDIFTRLEANLRGAHQDNVVVLMGSRRMGKTSILRRLHQHLDAEYVPVLIDLQGMIGSGESSFFRELVATIHDELEEFGIAVEEPPPKAFEIDPGHAFRRHFLKQSCHALGGRRLLLMFDEFEVLEGRIRSGDLEPRILPYFRSLMQHENNVSFIFAGTHRLDELTHDYWGVLFNLAVYLEVGYLSEEEIRQIFTQPTEQVFEIDSLALDKTYQLAGGHPHFSQLLARELVEHRNREQLAYITVQDVNAVAEQVVGKGQLHISYLWEEASRSQRLLMLALKELLDRKGLATLASAQRYLSEHRIEIGDPTVALRQLVRREILADNAGLITFRMDILKLWLDRSQDLESFLISENYGQKD